MLLLLNTLKRMALRTAPTPIPSPGVTTDDTLHLLYTDTGWSLENRLGAIGMDSEKSLKTCGQCDDIIIIMSCRQHRYPRSSLATPPYRSSLLAGPQGYILYPHRAAGHAIGSSWSSCFCSVILRGLLENITYDLVPASPAVSCMSGSSNFDSFRNGR